MPEVQKKLLPQLSKTGLKPCPFCGSTELSGFAFSPPEKDEKIYLVCCDCCGATGPHSTYDLEHARTGWQLRSTQL